MFDKALCGFGAGHQGLGLQNKDLEELFLPAVRVRTNRFAQMLALAGWWSIYLPWDFEAFLHFGLVFVEAHQITIQGGQT